MLNKIIILNSKPYTKAEITLDSDSLQIVGANNIGKTTLINCLNFLFIIDGNKMQFGDHDFVKSLNHYFPSSKQSPKNTSYMIFEIFKRGYYCIMLVKNEKNVEYYKIDNEYDENFFFDKKEKDQKILRNFRELNHHFMSQTSLKLESLKDKRQVFNLVYQRGRKNQGVVWVNENTRQLDLCNNFTKIYRYLINSKLINSDSLKESLMIADNKENEFISFSEKDKKDLIELDKTRNQIQKVNKIEKEFDTFKYQVNQFQKKNNQVAKLYYEFLEKYNADTLTIEKIINTNNDFISDTTEYLKNELNPKQDSVSKEIGKLEFKIETDENEFTKQSDELKIIESYETVEFLNQQLFNLQKQADDIDFQLKSITRHKLSKDQITKRISALKTEIQKQEKQIQNFDNLLIHNISNDNDVKKIINTILSKQITKSDKSKILQEITKTHKIIDLFNGKIEIDFDELQLDDIENLEDLKKELLEKQEDLKNLKETLKIIEQREKYETELKTLNDEIDEINSKLLKIESKEQLKTKIQEIVILLSETNDILKNKGIELQEIKDEFTEKSNSITTKKNDIFELKNKLSRYKTNAENFKELDIIPIETQLSENSIDKVVYDLRKELNEKNDLLVKKNTLKETIKKEMDCTYSDENELIKYVDDQISFSQIIGPQRIDELLQAIAEQFSKPTRTFLERYQHFKTYIGKFNQDLSQYKISDIEKINLYCEDNSRIIKELKQITEIQNIEKGKLLLFANNPENLTILDNYLKDSRKINFERLFDIHLEITKRNDKGELITTKADLSKEVESNGTNRMIKMFIFLLVINRMIESDKENKLAVYIDELGDFDTNNLEEIKKFCKENNFIPIFAAPRMIPDVLFDKYYLLAKENGRVTINEQRTIYVTKN